MLPLSPVEKLRPAHDTGPFDCGKEELNRFLKRFALINQRANSAQTYVACRGSVVIGYYSLSVGGVAHEDTPERVGKGSVEEHDVTAYVSLSRQALDVGQPVETGVGTHNSRDAMPLHDGYMQGIAGGQSFIGKQNRPRALHVSGFDGEDFIDHHPHGIEGRLNGFSAAYGRVSMQDLL